MSSDNYTGANDGGYTGANDASYGANDAARDGAGWIPAQRTATEPETMLLPIFAPVAAPAPEKSTARPERPHNPDKLPSDERNMLIFVSVLLAAGTLAIVAMASIGR